MIDLDALFADDPLPILPAATDAKGPAEPVMPTIPPYPAPEPAIASAHTPTVPLSHRDIARMALDQLEPDAGIRAKVWKDAEREERNWSFLIRDHGYPIGWFIFSHVDNYLRLKHGKGIATEGTGDGIDRWWICDAPDAGE